MNVDDLLRDMENRDVSLWPNSLHAMVRIEARLAVLVELASHILANIEGKDEDEMLELVDFLYRKFQESAYAKWRPQSPDPDGESG